MIAILDYGVGNLFSLCSSFRAIGMEAVVTANSAVIRSAERLILPGVGAFEDAARKLRESGLDLILKEEVAKGKPLLGICLGMQLLFEKSYEYGEHEGLGLIKGSVVPMKGSIPIDLKIPHIGWNALHFVGEKDDLFRYVDEGDFVYFVHSYYGVNDDGAIVATTAYGKELCAAVRQGNVMGCQFHPEKSGKVGLAILKAFCEIGE